MNDEMKGKSGKVKVMYVRSDDDSDKRTHNPRTGKGGGRPGKSRADGGRRPARDDKQSQPRDRKWEDSPWRTVSRAPGDETPEKADHGGISGKSFIDPEVLRRQRAEETRVYGENACQALVGFTQAIGRKPGKIDGNDGKIIQIRTFTKHLASFRPGTIEHDKQRWLTGRWCEDHFPLLISIRSGKDHHWLIVRVLHQLQQILRGFGTRPLKRNGIRQNISNETPGITGLHWLGVEHQQTEATFCLCWGNCRTET